MTPRARGALGEMYTAHARGLLAYFLRRVSSPEQAEDLVVETFIKAARYVGHYDQGEHSGRPWLFVTARSVLTDYYRTEGGRPSFLDIEHEAQLLAAIQEPRIDQEILEAVGRLPLKQAYVIAMHHLEGKSVRETARSLGVGESAVAKLLQRALQNLRVSLADWAPPDRLGPLPEVLPPEGMGELIERVLRAKQIRNGVPRTLLRVSPR